MNHIRVKKSIQKGGWTTPDKIIYIPDYEGAYEILSVEDFSKLQHQLDHSVDYDKYVGLETKYYDVLRKMRSMDEDIQAREKAVSDREADVEKWVDAIRKQRANIDELVEERVQEIKENAQDEAKAEYNRRLGKLPEAIQELKKKEAAVQQREASVSDFADHTYRQNRELKNAVRGITPKAAHTGYCVQRIDPCRRLNQYTASYIDADNEYKRRNRIDVDGKFYNLTIQLPYLSSEIRKNFREQAEQELDQTVWPKLFPSGYANLSQFDGREIPNGIQQAEIIIQKIKAGLPTVLEYEYHADCISGFWRVICLTTAEPESMPWEVSQPTREQAQRALKSRKKAQKQSKD